MSWFYIANTEQKGPVTGDELAVLVETGVVTAETQVWREGFAEWKLYGDVAAAPAVAPSGGLTLGLSGGTCSECGQSFAHEDLVKIGGRAVCGACKPTMVQQIKEGVSTDTAAEEIRWQHLKHEAAVRSVGALYIVGGVLAVLSALGSLFAPAKNAAGVSPGMGSTIFAALIVMAFAAGYFWLGISLRKLKRGARIPAGVLTSLGLVGGLIGCFGAIVLSVTIGLGLLPVLLSFIPPLVCVYILYLLFSRKGTMVFSDRYALVVEQTPHIKYRMWIVLKIVLILVGALVGLGLLAALLGSRSGGN